MNIRHISFFVFLFLFSNLIYTQQKADIDSLHKALATTTKDTTQVRVCSRIAMSYMYNKQDSAEFYGKKILSIAESTHNKWAEGVGYTVIGTSYFTRSEFTQSLAYFLKAINILEQIQPHTLDLARAYAQITSAYAELTDYKSGKEYGEKCINLYNTLNEKKLAAGAYNNVGNLYEKQKKYDKAETYYRKALDISREHDIKFHLALSYFNMGAILSKQGRIAESFAYIRQATISSRAIEDTEGMIYNYLELGHLYLLQNKLDSALLYADSASVVMQDYENLKLLEDCYRMKSEVFEKKGNIDSAYVYFKKSTALHDSLYNEFSQKLVYSLTTNQKINSLQEQSLLREQALNQQIIKNQVLLIMGICLLLVLLTLFFFNRQKIKHNNRLQAQNEQIEAQKEELSLLNSNKDKLISIMSHDLRSPINQMKGLLSLLNNKLISPEQFLAITQKFNNQVDALSDNLENILQWVHAQMRGKYLNKEHFMLVKVVESVAKLYEQALYQKNVHLKMLIPPDFKIFMDKEHLKLALRNLIGNALKFSHENSEIVIEALENDRFYLVKIIDKGLGMSQEQVYKILNNQESISTLGTLKETGTGVGLKLTKEFIEKSKGKLDIESEVGKGTCFTIFMPIES